MSLELDKIDRRILTLLQTDASLSAAEIAEHVNLSQPPCWRRIKRMEEAGIIQTRVAMLNRKQLGLNVVVYAEVKLSANGRQALGAFEEKIRSFPEVTECYVMLGRIDFLLRIVTRDIESYEEFFRHHLSQLPGVQDINSSVALSEVKYSTELPLELVP
ncbi:Lrp/AsnC family transcriptional regulator [Marinibactrum halimedae]|uniref:AsnC family transcriptional regulator n=1 Tax=Marinibactrum halimedae TaxID=1444977 RepID=A0AA37T3M6_9GAMM|nr:Lrp/AsnC family transcriptional regulator [Marinibactrum halimedae]MCD9460682.1 Lrp/AsnC family transcriptional regulator [Marinibactrum halimedae]GLS24328.1 AsnC family transcriptional regulator [Marinibactrum halimedae]